MKVNILVVDDESTIRESLQLILDEEGYETVTASDEGHPVNFRHF